MDKGEISRLEDLYFGLAPLTIRYVAPAILVTVLCGVIIISALVNPLPSMPWLYLERPKDQSPIGTNRPADPPSVDAGKSNAAPNSSGASGLISSNGQTAGETYWPKKDWRGQTLRGAALGFVGAYIYLLLLLTERALQRHITTGIATWAAAMPVLGLLLGGVAALIINTAIGTDASWTRDAIFFVAGMLPRQFAGFIQTGVQKMFQQPPPSTRTLPLMTLRGVGPDVASRLEEEELHDVSALAYTSPHQLIRATKYSPRQIVDWIDEALLIATVPANWDALEKAGVTGALDLAWYHDHQDLIESLATEIKLEKALLSGIVAKLSEDAEVDELHQLYWDKTDMKESVTLRYRFRNDASREARDTTFTEVKAMGAYET